VKNEVINKLVNTLIPTSKVLSYGKYEYEDHKNNKTSLCDAVLILNTIYNQTHVWFDYKGRVNIASEKGYVENETNDCQ
jgi:hypothetical protein